MSGLYAQGTAKAKPGATTDSLKEGDIIKAEIVSSENGTATLKTEEGHTIKAKLVTDALVAPGDKLALQVVGRESGVPLMAILPEGEPRAEAPLPEYMRDFNDKSLVPYAKTLSDLKLPVRENTAALMKLLMSMEIKGAERQDGAESMSLREAAFLASNKLQGTLIPQALNLAAGAKTGEMITALQNSLEATGQPGGTGAQTAAAAEPTVETSHATPIKDFVTTFVKLEIIINFFPLSMVIFQ